MNSNATTSEWILKDLRKISLFCTTNHRLLGPTAENIQRDLKRDLLWKLTIKNPLMRKIRLVSIFFIDKLVEEVMDGWMGGWTERGKEGSREKRGGRNGWMDGWMGGWTERGKEGSSKCREKGGGRNGWIDGGMDGGRDWEGSRDGWMDGGMDG
jgi:hypothetical protein